MKPVEVIDSLSEFDSQDHFSGPLLEALDQIQNDHWLPVPPVKAVEVLLGGVVARIVPERE